MRIRHPYLALDLPETFTSIPAKGDLLLHCLGDGDSELMVTVGGHPAGNWSPRTALPQIFDRFMADAERRYGVPIMEPVWRDDTRVLSVTYRLFYRTSWQLAHVVLATTLAPLARVPEMGPGTPIHPIVRLVMVGNASEFDAFRLGAVVDEALVAPDAPLPPADRSGSHLVMH